MMHTLLSNLRRALSGQSHRGLGKTWALFAFARAYCFGGSQAVERGITKPIISKSINGTVAGRLNPDRPIQSGRCRATLAPT